jgi:type II secretion system protein J
VRARAGFTLIEVLAAVLLTAIVVTAAVAFFINLSDAATRATDKTRDGRHGAAILDRVSRDLEGAFFLVKPADMDPLEHPWLFYAEDRLGMDGSDRLKFITTSHEPRESEVHTSDLAQVVYMLEAAPDGESYQLLRWSSPRLPEGLDRSFPDPQDERVQLVAEGVLSFRTRFLDAQGEWRNDWDSSTVAESSQLPMAVEVHVALLDPDAPVDALDEPPGLTRRVVLPVRPLDLQAMIAAADGTAGTGDEQGDEETANEEEDEDFLGRGNELGGEEGESSSGTMTVAQCIEANRSQLNALGVSDEYLNSLASSAPAPASVDVFGVTITCTR